MANIPEALAAKRRDCVKRMLQKLARGEAGSRWELSEWGERTHSDENFMLAVVKRLVERGLVKKSPYRPGGPAGAVPMVLSAALGATIDTSDETVIGLCWPSFAPPQLTDDQMADAALAREESAGGEEMAVEPEHDKLDVLIRVVGQLAENVVYMREKIEALPSQAAGYVVAERTIAPDLDAVLDLLGSIEGKADVAPLRTRLDQLHTRLGAIENRLTPVDTSKLEDTIKVVNAVATGANEQGERVEAAMGKFDQRIAAIEQAVGALLKRPTAHVQVRPDPDTGQILKKVNEISNRHASMVNTLGSLAGALTGTNTELDRAANALGRMVAELTKAEDVWKSSVREWEAMGKGMALVLARLDALQPVVQMQANGKEKR